MPERPVPRSVQKRATSPFGFNAILGLMGLAGILMRNTLILTEQIKETVLQAFRLSPRH